MSTSIEVYDLDDTLGASVTFGVRTDPNDASTSVPTDPTAVTFEILSPVTATKTTYVYLTDVELVRVTTGVYTVDIVVDEPGRWWYRWEGTGVAAGVEQGYIDVDYDRVNG
jgi:hypothetical protein